MCRAPRLSNRGGTIEYDVLGVTLLWVWQNIYLWLYNFIVHINCYLPTYYSHHCSWMVITLSFHWLWIWTGESYSPEDCRYLILSVNVWTKFPMLAYCRLQYLDDAETTEHKRQPRVALKGEYEYNFTLKKHKFSIF